MTQLEKLERLFRANPKGVTSMQIIRACGTTSPTRRVFELRERGWRIDWHKIDGQRHGRYFGKPPKGKKK